MGRLNRWAYLWRALLVSLLTNGIAFLCLTSEIRAVREVGPFVVVPPGTLLVVWFAVRRLHDLDRSGWQWFFFLVPLVNLYFGVLLVFFKGTDGPNRFGADPLGGKGTVESRARAAQGPPPTPAAAAIALVTVVVGAMAYFERPWVSFLYGLLRLQLVGSLKLAFLIELAVAVVAGGVAGWLHEPRNEDRRLKLQAVFIAFGLALAFGAGVYYKIFGPHFDPRFERLIPLAVSVGLGTGLYLGARRLLGPAPIVTPTVFRLRVEQGAKPGATLDLETERTYVIGPGGADLSLDEPSLSETQVELASVDGRWVLESRPRQLPLVNGAPARDPVALEPGAVIALGATTLAFEAKRA